MIILISLFNMYPDQGLSRLLNNFPTRAIFGQMGMSLGEKQLVLKGYRTCVIISGIDYGRISSVQVHMSICSFRFEK